MTTRTSVSGEKKIIFASGGFRCDASKCCSWYALKKRLQVYMKADVISSLQMLSTEEEVTETMLATLASFICAAYSPKGIYIETISELRWHLFCKHIAESDQLPPTL
ncbi:unnamed protein product [Arctogadus glacialis]